MECTECVRLAAERERRAKVYADALAKLREAEPSDDAGEYMMLRAVVCDAEIDMDFVADQIVQHRGQHEPMK